MNVYQVQVQTTGGDKELFVVAALNTEIAAQAVLAEARKLYTTPVRVTMIKEVEGTWLGVHKK